MIEGTSPPAVGGRRTCATVARAVLARPLEVLAVSDDVRGLLHHVELYVRDLERTVAFWAWLLGRLGYAPYQEWDEGISWRSGATYLAFVQAAPGAAALDRRAVGLNHLAFHATSPEEVDELTEALRERGVRVLYGDRHPYAGGTDHYAVFFEDPDGLKVEVVADRLAMADADR
jgi:catechol 2,3-dioxygenase-like lactoylglutathione lyase family enzyme